MRNTFLPGQKLKVNQSYWKSVSSTTDGSRICDPTVNGTCKFVVALWVAVGVTNSEK